VSKVPVAAAHLSGSKARAKVTQKLRKSDAGAMPNPRSKRVTSAGGSGSIVGNEARAKVTQKLHKCDADAMANRMSKLGKGAGGTGTICGDQALQLYKS